jgi:hypothetical protein
VLLLLAGTDTAAVPGISAAGATPESRRWTAAADAELLLLGPGAKRHHALPPLPAGIQLLFPASTTRAQLQHFFALAEPLPPAAAAETLGRVLERALARGEQRAPLGPLWIAPTADTDVIAVATATTPQPAVALQAGG